MLLSPEEFGDLVITTDNLATSVQRTVLEAGKSLAVAVGHAQILLFRGDLPEDAQEQLRAIVDNSLTTVRLLDQLHQTSLQDGSVVSGIVEMQEILPVQIDVCGTQGLPLG
jgi:hypothetical protein